MHAAYQNIKEYAFSTWTLDTLPLQDALDAIARSGFSSVELWADTVHFDPRTNIELSKVCKWLSDCRLKVHSVHAPFRNYVSPPSDEAEFRKLRMELLKKTLRNMNDMTIPIMVLHAVNRFEYNYSMSQRQIVGDFLSELCQYARRLGIQIALENIPTGEGLPDEIPTTLKEQIPLYPGIGLKYCLDIGHALLAGIDPIEEARAAGKDLIATHIHNNDGQLDSHEMPGNGLIDWPKLYLQLKEMGFKGEHTLEVFGPPDPVEIVKKARALFA